MGIGALAEDFGQLPANLTGVLGFARSHAFLVFHELARSAGWNAPYSRYLGYHRHLLDLFSWYLSKDED